MKSFFTLELAVAFAQDCERAKLPKHLKDQFLRASSSVALNLAEGAAKPTEADRKRFYLLLAVFENVRLFLRSAPAPEFSD